MRATQLLVVRHGETIGNQLQLDPPMSGHVDLPLTSAGREQARNLAQVLRSEPISAVFTSPLARARDTARVIAEGRPCSLLIESSLQEIDCGEVDGEPVSSVVLRLRELWERNESQTDDDFRWPGGESYRELRTRVVRAVEKIARTRPGQTLVIVTHAGPITQLLGSVLGLPPRYWKPNRPENGSITELLWSEPELKLIQFGILPESWRCAQLGPIAG